MACKEGQFDAFELMVNDQFNTFSINLNAQHVSGMTPFDLALSTVIRYSRVRKEGKARSIEANDSPLIFLTPYIYNNILSGEEKFVVQVLPDRGKRREREIDLVD